jgi:hypothetical protein
VNPPPRGLPGSPCGRTWGQAGAAPDLRRRAATLFSTPGPLGYTSVQGPHPFGVPVRLPAPFGTDLGTADF